MNNENLNREKRLAIAMDRNLQRRGLFLLWNTDAFPQNKNQWAIARENGEILFRVDHVANFARTFTTYPEIAQSFMDIDGSQLDSIDMGCIFDPGDIDYMLENVSRVYTGDGYEFWYLVRDGEIAIRYGIENVFVRVEVGEFGDFSQEHECLNPYTYD